MKLYTSKAVAEMLDLTERRVRMLRDENIIAEYKPGSNLYDLKMVTHQYINYLRGNSPNGEGKADYNTERALLMKAKRERQELELEKERNELHATEDVEQVLTDMLIKFKTRLMSIPAKLGPKLAKKTDQTEIFQMLKSAIDEALEELSDFQTLFGEVEENEESDT